MDLLPTYAARRRGAAAGVVLAVGLGLGLAGCGAEGAASSPASSSPSSLPSSAPADARAVDVTYARAMIPHHEQALALAALVPGRSASADVADLAFRIDRDQVEEVGQLQGLLRSWGVDPAAGAGDMSGMSGMEGMAAPAVLDRLRGLSGPAFDRLWLETMVAHHRGALAMARQHLATAGPGSALTEFSRSVLAGQQAEVDRMQALLVA